MAAGANLIDAIVNTWGADRGASGLYTTLGQLWLNEVPKSVALPFAQIRPAREDLDLSVEYPIWDRYPVIINVVANPAATAILLAKRVLAVFKFDPFGEPPISVTEAFTAYLIRRGYEVQDTRDRNQSDKIVTRVSILYESKIADLFNG